MAYTIALPTPGQNLSASLYGKAVRDAIIDLDSRVSVLEGIVIARVAKVKVIVDSAAFTTEIQYTTINATLLSGYTYGISVIAAIGASGTLAIATNPETALCRIREDNVSGTQQAGPQVFIPTTSANGFFVQAYAEYTPGANGNKVFSITGQRNGGNTGTTHLFRAGATRPTLVYIDLIAVP